MKVKFVPQNVEFEIEPGKSVMHVAQDHGLYVKSVCKGVPNCAECRVRIVEGEHNVMPPGSEELSLIGTGHFIDRRRLSCQLKCFGDITVDMSEQLAKQQGLILGNKKKAALKDDRVEEAVARRGENAVDEETSADANGDVVHQHAPKPSRDPRDARETRETRDTRPPGDRTHGGRGGGRPPQGDASARPQGDGSSRNRRGGAGGGPGGRPSRGPTEGGGDRSPRGAREAVRGHTPSEAAQDLTATPQDGAPGANAGSAAGGEGGKRRRRRRGKGGGGSAGGAPGGSPGGSSGGSPGGRPPGGGGGAPSGRPGSRPGSGT